ncbi:hypothetical protein GCM10011611_02550 [Aliidongia dinghuensis]|uniref:Uncharacterized protein n=1 Tax=Aliidongia dinghuensis TaxID=1867774 RepID=A0A8J3E0B9_9PROT|nr:hypothetical protein GCM10011611_02550 [Aliidongia dinghuensis]
MTYNIALVIESYKKDKKDQAAQKVEIQNDSSASVFPSNIEAVTSLTEKHKRIRAPLRAKILWPSRIRKHVAIPKELALCPFSKPRGDTHHEAALSSDSTKFVQISLVRLGKIIEIVEKFVDAHGLGTPS